MKKLLTLLVFPAIISSSFAQSITRGRKSHAMRTSYQLNASIKPYEIINQREAEIQSVNDQNNYSVQLLLEKADLNIWDKRDILNRLEMQRIDRINSIYAHYNNEMAFYNHTPKKTSFNKNLSRD